MVVYIVNGKLVGEHEPVFDPSSRCYRYGDGFFESMRYTGKQILHANLHFARIQKSTMLLKMTLPEWFERESFEQMVVDAAETAGIEHARIRCTIFREAAGLYTPVNAGITVVTEIQKLNSAGYEWNDKGLHLGSFRELAKNSNYISMLKTTSALINVMAAIYSQENGFDDCLIYNEMGRVAECIGSNIFTVSGEFLNTPPLSEYCVDGVMRKVVMNIAQAYGYTLLEQPVSEVTISSADEIFLTSATRGIRWVGQYGGKNYKSIVSKVLFEKLNKELSREV